MQGKSKATRQVRVVSTSQKRRHRFRSWFGVPDMTFTQAANRINLKHTYLTRNLLGLCSSVIERGADKY